MISLHEYCHQSLKHLGINMPLHQSFMPDICLVIPMIKKVIWQANQGLNLGVTGSMARVHRSA